MFRINLLPQEVVERRKYEDWFPRVFIASVVFILIAFGVYGFFSFQANLKRGDLQSIQDQSKQYSAEADQLAIFENKEQDLQKRQDIATTALAGRVNIGQVANDISLVLPDEVWLDLLTIDQNTGLTLQADTPRTAGETADVAFKSVAKTLVRLNQIPDLSDVWLTTAVNATWSGWATVAGHNERPTVKVVTFQATGKVVPANPTGAVGSSVSAASSSATHTVNYANQAQGAVNAINGQTPTGTAP